MPKSAPAKIGKSRATSDAAAIKIMRPPRGPRTISHSQIKKWAKKVFKARAMTDA